jgi:small nuclear ribonucleoprotein (snRNP)-like protein
MVASSIPTTNLLFIFLFLIPGYFTLRIFIWQGKAPISFDRFDKAILSVLLSALSLSVIVLSYDWQIGLNLANPLAAFSLVQLALGFVLQTTINILVGILSGVIYDYQRDEEVYRPNLWVHTIRSLGKPIQVQVVTKSGAELSGQVKRYDRTQETPSLLLENFQVLKEPSGNKQVDSREGSVYIPAEDVAYIWLKDN